MKVKQQIAAKITAVYGVNNPHIFKGYDLYTNKTGWHYRPFNDNATYSGKPLAGAIYLGKSLAEAMQALDQIAEHREQDRDDINSDAQAQPCLYCDNRASHCLHSDMYIDEHYCSACIEPARLSAVAAGVTGIVVELVQQEVSV